MARFAGMSVVPLCHDPTMCRICEGFSQEDDLALDAATIAEYGFMVTGVGDADHSPWAYTVGLFDRVRHPELIIAGTEIVESGRLLNEIGRLVLAGRTFAAGDTWESPDGLVRFGRVDPLQFRLGTFNVWLALAEAGYLCSEGFVAIQVFVPESWLCHDCRESQPVLSRPESRVGLTRAGPDRAARRARRR